MVITGSPAAGESGEAWSSGQSLRSLQGLLFPQPKLGRVCKKPAMPCLPADVEPIRCTNSLPISHSAVTSLAARSTSLRDFQRFYQGLCSGGNLYYFYGGNPTALCFPIPPLFPCIRNQLSPSLPPHSVTGIVLATIPLPRAAFL